MTRRQHGFNLIEVMVTLTVLAVLISLGAPGFSEWLKSLRVRASTEAITNGMQVARGEAIRRNLAVSFGLALPPTTAWTVCEATVSPCDSTTPAANVIQSKSFQEGSGAANTTTIPTGANVTATPAGATLVTFSPLGNVIDNPDGTSRLTQVDVSYPPEVCSADGGSMRCLRIVVSPAGSIRACDPTPTIVAPDPRVCP